MEIVQCFSADTDGSAIGVGVGAGVAAEVGAGAGVTAGVVAGAGVAAGVGVGAGVAAGVGVRAGVAAGASVEAAGAAVSFTDQPCSPLLSPPYQNAKPSTARMRTGTITRHLFCFHHIRCYLP